MNLQEQLVRELNPNPFSKEYYQSEKEAYTTKAKPLKIGKIELEFKSIKTILRGHMYNGVVREDNVPVFKIEDTVWMSLTPMEVESHYIPIQLANGRVGVGGLGAGYYVQRILDKDEVDEVVVYEIDQAVIDFYLQQFGEHKKLTIKKENVLEIKNESFHFFYMDIYLYGMSEEAVVHMQLLNTDNNIDVYHFWTQEAVYAELMLSENHDDIPLQWRKRYNPFALALLNEKADCIALDHTGDDWYELLEEYNFGEPHNA